MNKLFVALLFLFCTSAPAQFKKLYFNTLDVKTGLPEANVVTRLQDKNGYLWLATQNGLVRYDGYQFKPYPMFTGNGIAGTFRVKILQQDCTGKIWA